MSNCPNHHRHDGRECVFCAITRGETPAHRVHEDELALAFLDINPVTPGHLLVVPKRHAAGLADLSNAENDAIFRAGRRLAAALRSSGLDCEGINYFLADGEAAFQEVFHVHLHIFPRFRGDSFRIHADWSKPPVFAELAGPAERITTALASFP